MDFRKCLHVAVSAPLLAAFISCGNGSEIQEEDFRKSDSISTALNSPELKNVNKELLEDPGNAGLTDKRARIYMKLGLFKEAGNDARRAILADSAKPEYYMTLVDVHFASNNTRLAKELLLTMERKFPENADALLKLAELHYLVMKYQEAIDYVNKALRADEHRAAAYYLKGTVYRESGDTARAISSLETTVEQDNKFVDAYYDLGVIYAARKNPVALDYYHNVLRLDPSHNKARYARALFLQNTGRIDDAVLAYEEANKSDPEYLNCLYNLGAIYLELKKDPGKAIEYFTKAIRLKPEYSDAYFARAVAFSRLKDYESARADYKMCLMLTPDYEPAIKGLNELEGKKK